MLRRFICPVLRRLKWLSNLLPLGILAIFILVFGPVVYVKIYQNWDRDPDRGAIAIEGGAYGESYSTPRYLEQGWSAANSLWFYNTTQGSGLLPYDFFMVLKQSDTDDLFRSNKNIDRYRYLPQKKTFFNPDGLPVGFVKDTYEGKDYVGYTCSACHTGQINYKGQALRIDGGPAMADMVGFLTSLQKALEAAKSGEKQKDFIADVLALKNTYSTAKAVTDDLEKWTSTIDLYNTVNHSGVKYGHARLDAFGRIYNRVIQHAISWGQVKSELALVQVYKGTEKKPLLTQDQIDKVMDGLGSRIVLSDDDFSKIVQRLESKEPGYPGLSQKEFLSVRDRIFNHPNAPVSYPFLWDIAHSDYVQWNGLASNAAAGPLGRNAGEVIGVFGILDWGKEKTSWLNPFSKLSQFSLAAILSGQQNKKEIIEFKSSINLFNLQRLESQLTSLKSPEWPFCRNTEGEYYLPATAKTPISPSAPHYCQGNDTRFNEDQKQRGEQLYIDRCQSCHTVIKRDAWDRVVVGNMVSLDKIGTDPAMAENSVANRGKSGNFKDTYQAVDVGSLVVQEDAPVVQILTAATKGVVGSPDADKWFLRRWSEWIYSLVASFADNTIKSSVKNGNYDPDTTSKPYASLLAYRARSLNGIWATAPYLHNGSVPTLWDVLLPADQRPKLFKVGTRDFDPNKVGFKNEGMDFNTIQPGNYNTGHDKYCSIGHFAPTKDAAVKALPDEDAVAAKADADCTLTEGQMWDLIEYLKSL
ncbi:MAG TPA: di-heme-cytochrome C peroxidase [Bradyrhizobium sp.]|nr:di-heme-cytochrome C peroxidase [Bradyrhizobium sp.]